MKRKTLDLPLHYGKCPAWLFGRMKRLSRAIIGCIIYEEGPVGFLEKLSDPYFFQALGCVLAFDWHSSGLTTTVCGAMKEGLKGTEHELGVYVCGGKGKTSRNTPDEIKAACDSLAQDPARLIYASRISAKVDSCCVQDGYDLYQHNFFFTPPVRAGAGFTRTGAWSVVQQGMNLKTRYARRYHWFSDKMNDFVCEPHTAICCDKRQDTLNMVAEDSKGARQASTEAATKGHATIKEVMGLKEKALPARHKVLLDDIDPKRLDKVLLKTYQNQPKDFESLLITKGVGPKTIRALSLIAELVYNKPPSFRDPARFSYAHGGKDGYPYPVDRETYESSIGILERAIKAAKIGRTEKLKALKTLAA